MKGYYQGFGGVGTELPILKVLFHICCQWRSLPYATTVILSAWMNLYKMVYTGVYKTVSGKSLIKVLNSEGGSTDFWGNPSLRVCALPICPFKRMWYLWLLNIVARSIVLWHLMILNSLSNSPYLHAMSQVVDKTSNAVLVFTFHWKPANVTSDGENLVMTTTPLSEISLFIGRMVSKIQMKWAIRPSLLTWGLWRGVILGDSWQHHLVVPMFGESLFPAFWGRPHWMYDNE